MRVYNFSAGPAMLPLPVLEKAASEMCDVGGTGQSVLEVSHRSKDFVPIIEKAEGLLRELMEIPDNYRVLFVQGGASLQFAMVPLNLAASGEGEAKRSASYIDTGIWAKKAYDEASKYCNAAITASSKDRNYTYIPKPPPARKDDVYYHICLNNTIVGTRWPSVPMPDVPLVADVSSIILSEKIDVSRFGLLYAGAQKNLGPAGVTVVIVRDDLIGKAPSWVPTMLRYETYAAEKSMYNTPPCYSIYIMGLVLEWVKGQGGVAAMEKVNREKAGLLYRCLDEGAVFHSPVEKADRSLMNVPFVSGKPELDALFVKKAAEAGLVNLSGHRLVGGLRASIYNAMPISGVEALVTFINKM
jgi:phosphoserine aminotransferase